MKTIRRWLWRSILALLLLIAVYQSWLYWRVQRLAATPPSSSALMEQRLAEKTAQNRSARIDYRWVPLSRIAKVLQRAIIVSEDATFYTHEGFDLEGIKVAIAKNSARGRVVAGGSTITQQLAKNLFLSPQRSYVRKGQEAILTLMLEHALEKKRIFEIYLNVIEWGDGIFGAEAAARHYFNKPAAALNATEAAWLAAIVPNPRHYDKRRASKHAARKARIILARMKARYGRTLAGPPRVVTAVEAARPELKLPVEPVLTLPENTVVTTPVEERPAVPENPPAPPDDQLLPTP